MKNNLKIVMTTDTVGGVWNYSLALCEALQPYGAKVHLVAMGGLPSKTQEEEAALLKNVVLYKSDYKLEWMQDPWRDVQEAQKWLTTIYQTVHPDLVHLNNYTLIENFWSCPVVTVYHSCVQTWWQAVKGCNAPSEWDTYMWLVKDALNASDKVVFPTEALRKKALLAHQFISETEVIHNGCDVHFDENPPKEKFILCTGRIWDEAKNLPALCRLAKMIPWPIYVAGDNIDPSTKKPVTLDNVHFLGKLSAKEVRYWMQKCEIYVNPSKYEPFGLAVLEAAVAGCALAVADIKTLKELWNGSAVFFDPTDPVAIKKALFQLIEDPAYREELMAKAQERSHTYSAGKMAAAYINLYQNLLAKNKISNQSLML